jgi:hypothetical protein
MNRGVFTLESVSSFTLAVIIVWGLMTFLGVSSGFSRLGIAAVIVWGSVSALFIMALLALLAGLAIAKLRQRNNDC